MGPFVERLEEALAEDGKLPKRQRRAAVVLFEQLQADGYAGSYDSVRRHVRDWRRRQSQLPVEVYIPLVFEPGEAFQFDWSHELVEMAGMPVTVKAAQLRLCHSRHFLVVAYPRETQEMVFDAHAQAFEFFGGVCRRGIYDNLKAAVNKILTGKQRSFNNRFGQLCSQIYAEFAQILIAQARTLYAADSFDIELEQAVYVLDSTTIDLCLALFPWAEFRKRKGAIKLHTLLDLQETFPLS